MNGKRLLCGLLCLVLMVGLLPTAFAAQTSPEANVTAFKPKYTLTFNANGGTSVRPIVAETGKYIYLASYSSTRNGYYFDGWFSDEALTHRITEVIIDQDKTIYAGWKKANPNDASPFPDIPVNAWYAEDVNYVYSRGIIQGTSPTTFSPNAALTRAMLVTILYRAAGSPLVSGECPFPDVEDEFYGEAPITWAYNHGLVTGFIQDGTFRPNSGVTREEMIVILYRFAQNLGVVHDESGMILREYSDGDKVSEYAAEAMRWALHNGILTGTGNTTLAPQGRVTRAQGAAILHRFDLYLKENTK